MPAHSSAAQAKAHAQIRHSLSFLSFLSIDVPGHTAPGAGHETIHLLKEARETPLLPECSEDPQRHHTTDPQIFPGPSRLPWDALAPSASSRTNTLEGRREEGGGGRSAHRQLLPCPSSACPPKPFPFPLRPSRVPAGIEVHLSASIARPVRGGLHPPPYNLLR